MRFAASSHNQHFNNANDTKIMYQNRVLDSAKEAFKMQVLSPTNLHCFF